MGTITGTKIIARLRKRLLDPGGDFWGDDELLTEINSAQRAVVTAKPDAYVLKTSIQMNVGTEQTIANNCVGFVRFLRNTGPDGNTQDRAARFVDFDEINRTFPDWHATDPAGLVENYTHDIRDPTRFYVWPPQPDPPFYADILCWAIPQNLLTAGDTIALNDIYEDAIYYYVLSQAYANNTERGDTGKASYYTRLFFNILGVKDQTQMKETVAVNK